jgi:acyloxyacyl hydrolase
LKNKFHPFGAKYSDFYNFLSCLDLNPCPSWMSNNQTLREYTEQYVVKLNKIYEKIVKEKSSEYKFKINYFDCPMSEIYEEFEKKGLDASVLIESMDGFFFNFVFFFYFNFKI